MSSTPHTPPPVLREKLPETITWLSLYKTYLSLRHLSSYWLGSMWMQSLFQSSSTHPYFIATTTETLITYSSSKISTRHKTLSLLHQTLHPALHCLCGASLPVVREAGWWCGCECVGDSLPACRDSVLLLPQVPSSHPNPLVCWVLRCPRVFCRSCKINNNTYAFLLFILVVWERSWWWSSVACSVQLATVLYAVQTMHCSSFSLTSCTVHSTQEITRFKYNKWYYLNSSLSLSLSNETQIK